MMPTFELSREQAIEIDRLCEEMSGATLEVMPVGCYVRVSTRSGEFWRVHRDGTMINHFGPRGERLP